MTAPLIQRKPTFLWQGLLILVPVLVLVAAGLWTLREDRVAIERDARLRAEPIAATVLAEFGKRLLPIDVEFRGEGRARALRSRKDEMWFELLADNSLDQNWQFTWPPTPAPFPTNLIASIEPNRVQLWVDAGVAYKAGDWDKAVELYSAFAADGRVARQPYPPYERVTEERLRGEANYRLATALERLGQTNQAVEAYDAVLLSFRSPYNVNDTRSEAGLPLTHLATLRIFNLAGNPTNLPRRWQTNVLSVLQLLRNDGSPFGGELVERFAEMLKLTPDDLKLPAHLENASEKQKQWHLKVLQKNFRFQERDQCEFWHVRQET